MAVHPNSLANLKPAKRGEVRNPKGHNQYTKDSELSARFRAVCFALESCETPEESHRLLSRIFNDIFDGAIAGDSRLLHALFCFLMPLK